MSLNLQFRCSWGKEELLNFEIKRSKVKVTARHNMVSYGTSEILRSHLRVTDNLFGEGILVDDSPSRIIYQKFIYMCYFVSMFSVVTTCAIDCLQK